MKAGQQRLEAALEEAVKGRETDRRLLAAANQQLASAHLIIGKAKSEAVPAVVGVQAVAKSVTPAAPPSRPRREDGSADVGRAIASVTRALPSDAGTSWLGPSSSQAGAQRAAVPPWPLPSEAASSNSSAIDGLRMEFKSGVESLGQQFAALVESIRPSPVPSLASGQQAPLVPVTTAPLAAAITETQTVSTNSQNQSSQNNGNGAGGSGNDRSWGGGRPLGSGGANGDGDPPDDGNGPGRGSNNDNHDEEKNKKKKEEEEKPQEEYHTPTGSPQRGAQSSGPNQGPPGDPPGGPPGGGGGPTRHPVPEHLRSEGDLFSREADGTLTSRKEAESLTFPRFNDVTSFNEAWMKTFNEVIYKSARREQANVWFNQIENIKEISFEDLNRTGAIFEQYDGKCMIATKKACEGQLILRRILRIEKEIKEKGGIMSGRQALRLVYLDNRTDKVRKALFNVRHFQVFKYPGDHMLGEFMEVWFKMESDQQQDVSEDQKRTILLEKLSDPNTGSKVLKPG